jgi:hypothetical protein
VRYQDITSGTELVPRWGDEPQRPATCNWQGHSLKHKHKQTSTQSGLCWKCVKMMTMMLIMTFDTSALHPQIEEVKAPILGVFGGKDKHVGEIQMWPVRKPLPQRSVLPAAALSCMLHPAASSTSWRRGAWSSRPVSACPDHCICYICYVCMVMYVSCVFFGVGFREEVVGLVHGCTCVGARWGKLPRMRCYCVA